MSPVGDGGSGGGQGGGFTSLCPDFVFIAEGRTDKCPSMKDGGAFAVFYMTPPQKLFLPGIIL